MPRNHARFRRHPDALLAGVCARVAQTLGWNTWAVRALAVLGLLIDALVTGGIYLTLAVLMSLVRPGQPRGLGADLASPELHERKERIAELERRFRKLEEESEA